MSAWRRVGLGGSALVTAALLLAGCTGTAPNPTPEPPASGGDPVPGGAFTALYTSNPTSLDPIAGNSGDDHQTLYLVYDRLIDVDAESQQPVPSLVSDWNFSDDGLTLTLELEEGVTFHDGTPFNADAVKFNLDRAKNSPVTTIAANLANVASIDVVDESTVELTMSPADRSIVMQLADRPGMMVSPTAIETNGEDALARNPVGTGPYVFDSWAPNDSFKAHKNADYWRDGLPYFDSVDLRYILNTQAQVAAFASGEGDFIIGPALAQLSTIEGLPGVQISSTPSLYLEMCYFNVAIEPFNDIRVREAFNLGINREAINQGFLFGQGVLADQLFPTGYWANTDGLPGYEYDPDRAMELLAEAGYPDGLDIAALTYTLGDQPRKSEIVQAELAKIGVNMDLQAMEIGAAAQAFFGDLKTPFYCGAWSGRPDPSTSATLVYGGESYFNAGGNNPEGMTEAIAASASAATPEERAAAFDDINRIAQENAQVLPLAFVPDVNAWRGNVGGFQPDVLGKSDISFLYFTE